MKRAFQILALTLTSLFGIICLGRDPAVAQSNTTPARDEQLVKLRAVPFTEVQISDSFWAPRQEVNRKASIPVNLENLVKAGNISNFELAAKGAKSGFQGLVFMDSDVYKGLEAASYSLATHPDPALEKRLDEIIAALAAAQQPDGYLNTYFILKEPGKRWTNLRDWHELYCAGHMFEAAVAHFQATGKRNFLAVATRFADHIDSVFGPGKRMGYPGHPEIELALVKLWRVTGELRYFNLARFFIENRGKKFFAEEHQTPIETYDGSYWQDDVPICDHENIKGHAVRACYLLSGATDVAAETGDSALLKMIHRVWRNTIERNLYLTGGIGPSAHNEGFTVDYDLPNPTAYQETCATIALAQWNHRLALLHGDAKYSDVVERSLYNGTLSGVSQDGTRFFYVNPLESRGTHHRQPWFGCACCPPNVARTVAALGGYAYAVSDTALWVNLYIQGAVKAKIGGKPVAMKVTTDYPWDGRVKLSPEVASPSRFEIRLRIPGWSRQASVSLNGSRVEPPVLEKGYAVLSREWKSGDVIELNLSMPVERIAAHPSVAADRGRVALQRGPLVYCFESVDQTAALGSVYLPENTEFNFVKENGAALGPMVAITGSGRLAAEQDWKRRLYQPVAASQSVALKAIPYYLWDNRAAGPMKVWMPVAPPTPVIQGLESRAEVTVSFASNNSRPAGINDGLEPKSSSEQPPALCHWWPHKGGEEWVQYSWKQPVRTGAAKVYWFDDTGRGGCRLPAEWRLEYQDQGQWKPVAVTRKYPISRDQWCEIGFEPVSTTSMRLVVKLPPDFASGVHEWKIVEAEE
ncbi:MAG: glycoside hydrolase family 127 protein [Acidobacteria bacterium]|nr:MAG: glycoside hydrolase family 127 protein [Acidobacteriota bacterium]